MELSKLIERIQVFDDTQEVVEMLETMHNSATAADKYAIRESQAHLIGMQELLKDIREAYDREIT